jgi:hypothetical protein
MAMSFRNTVVDLNRTEADLAKEAALVDAYNRGMNAVTKAVDRREQLMLQLKGEALTHLPPQFRAAAMERDLSAVPSDMNPPTHTPPIDDYDPQESYARARA